MRLTLLALTRLHVLRRHEAASWVEWRRHSARSSNAARDVVSEWHWGTAWALGREARLVHREWHWHGAWDSGREAHVLRSVVGGQLGSSLFDALVESNYQRLSAQRLAVHVSDGLASLFRVRETDEAEALGGLGVVLLSHDAGRGDGPEGSEGLLELLVSDSVGDVLHVQVHVLVLGGSLELGGLLLGLHFSLSLDLLLSTSDVESEGGAVFLDDFAVQFIDGLGSTLVVVEVGETEALRLALGVLGDSDGEHSAVGLQQVSDSVLGPRERELLQVQVSPVVLGGAILTTNEVGHGNLDIVDKHAVELLNGVSGGLGSLKVDIAVSLGRALVVLGDLTGEDVAEDGEGVVQALMVHRRSEVADEDVAEAGLAERRISLGPHDTAWAATDVSEVHGVESTLSVLDVVEVHIGITQ